MQIIFVLVCESKIWWTSHRLDRLDELIMKLSTSKELIDFSPSTYPEGYFSLFRPQLGDTRNEDEFYVRKLEVLV